MPKKINLYSELAPSFDYLFFFEKTTKTTISSTMSSSASTSASSDGGRKLRFEKENKTILFKTIRRKIKRINQESGPLVQKNYIWYKQPYGFNSKYVKSLSDIELQVFRRQKPLGGRRDRGGQGISSYSLWGHAGSHCDGARGIGH